ncbi:type II secretion system major pseudopilin GspG [Burkholderia stagnalis]|uniref:type II secretion system major pseudopilin GspG n=1 Tax=Burkholderia stagnalis TaxID=1503054 RepID=UPI000F5F16FF|nr:type II secretion system major pseudopilin GspG [Burkholderia stagnalis]RQX88321.1 type II secretion system protein GspG [Burkholderia stagnalis]RQY33362.1 type II secretion system protein GspG [Burkholderia stagnalis]RQY56692.1 type II secretion system protein GspG [Burkholderia stagnalis]RQY86466.1 type II secretion system protein GspG [Burkholderia stagnalis]
MTPRITIQKNNLQKGFTLLELLVVLVIIGLLAGIVGPRLFANVDKSKETTAKAQIDVLSKAVDQLRLDIGRYPTTQEGLGLLMTPPADGTPGWNGPYLKKAVPVDPWGTPYQYASPGTHNIDYDIVSYGPARSASAANAIHN